MNDSTPGRLLKALMLILALMLGSTALVACNTVTPVPVEQEDGGDEQDSGGNEDQESGNDSDEDGDNEEQDSDEG